ncbi:MAG: tetratricopeptide repeat protein, partial [Verrucomicrobia bacterium]|nr:tetratricopeptide repeat protein [Verrucomicrobiota bacterium]
MVVGISCPASKPARPSLFLKFNSGTVVCLRPADWRLDSQHQPGILRLMNAQPNHPIILLREVEKGEWWMDMPRITVEIDDRLDEGIDWMRSGDFRRATAIFSQLIKELPEHLDAYHHLALTLQRAGRGKEAADVWRCAVELALKFFPDRFDFARHQLPWLE